MELYFEQIHFLIEAQIILGVGIFQPENGTVGCLMFPI